MTIETCAQRFDMRGDRWDTRRDKRDPIVQALCERFDRTERERKAEGYDGPLKPVRHGRDFRAPVQRARAERSLKMVELDTWRELTREKPLECSYTGNRKVGTVRLPTEEIHFPTEEEHQKKANEFSEWIRAERQKMVRIPK